MKLLLNLSLALLMIQCIDNPGQTRIDIDGASTSKSDLKKAAPTKPCTIELMSAVKINDTTAVLT